MTQKTLQAHATTADITAIIAAHKAAVTAQSIPVAPQSQPKPTPAPAPVKPTVAAPAAVPAPKPATPAPAQPTAPGIHAQSIQAPATAAPTVTDDSLTTFLTGHLPDLVGAAQAAVTAPFSFGKVLTLSQAVSQAVHDGLPLVKGAEAAQLVDVIAAYLWDKYAAPLPDSVKLFAPVLRSLMLAGIEAAYRFGVKKVGAKPA